MQSKSKANVPKGNVGNHHLPDVRKVIPVPLTQPEYLEALRNLKSVPGGEVERSWTDADRAACRKEWERRVCSAIDDEVDDGLEPNKKDSEYEAGLQLVRELAEAREEIEGRKDQISDLHELRESAESERDQLQQEKEKYRLDAEWQYTECNRLRQQIADAVKELGFALESSGEIAIVAYIGGLLACIQKSRSILAPPAQGKGRERNDSRYEATTKRRRTFR